MTNELTQTGTNPDAPKMTPEDGNESYAASLQAPKALTEGEIDTAKGIVPGSDSDFETPIPGVPQQHGGFKAAGIAGPGPVLTTIPPVSIGVDTDASTLTMAHANGENATLPRPDNWAVRDWHALLHFLHLRATP